MYTARLTDRWRAIFVVASLAASAPVLALSPSAWQSVVAVLLIVVQAGAVWFLGERPGPATAAVLLVSAGFQTMFPSYGPGIAFVVLCTYAWLRPAAQTLWAPAVGILAVCGPAAVRGNWVAAGLWLGAVLLAWSWGALARARGEWRAAERRQAVLEERARIARELHDVLSHTVSVMVVQAAAADDIFDANPVQAREALRRTEQAGREALAELRGFLRTVRAEDEDSAPAPTLADVDRLVTTMGEAGLRVTLRREGDGEVPLGVQLSAYRIVQEALTNTLRHAGAAAAEVLVAIDDAEVHVRVTDDGGPLLPLGRPVLPSGKPALPPGKQSKGSGQGLVGMRERAGLLGGTVSAGPRAGGGFEVDAHLPIGAKP
jgi:signal transduction histidine kinase